MTEVEETESWPQRGHNLTGQRSKMTITSEHIFSSPALTPFRDRSFFLQGLFCALYDV